MTRARVTPALIGLAAAALVAGCGSNGAKIPRGNATELIAYLRQADARTAAKACTGLAQQTIPALERQVSLLPAKTDPDIRSSLRNGIENLRNLIATQCSTVTPKPKKTTQSTQTQTQTTQTTTQTQTQSTQTQTQTQTNTNTNTSTGTGTTPTTPTTPSGGTPPGQHKGASGKAKGAKR